LVHTPFVPLGYWSPCTPLVWNEGFPTPLGGLSVSIDSIKAPDICFSSCQFREQHPLDEKAIASRYITDPVLFYRNDLQANVKFDIRYVVLLRSVKPLILYTYKVFWLRFANKPFILDDFDSYDRHFTVMNYRSADSLKQVSIINILCILSIILI
uniref:Transmembrane 9 superfamily member n=1 Tax=Schistosoma curassoni TaxID=6186 RepID=A0A183L115_9TREM